MDDLKKTTYLLPFHLQFFADAAEKTEDATGKKLTEARKSGQVARSKELTTAVELMALFVILGIYLDYIGDKLQETFAKSFGSISEIAGEEYNIPIAQSIINDAIITVILTCLPVLIGGMFVSFVVVLFQVKWKVSGKPLHPKFSKINPISGFKKIFSKDKAVGMIMELVKILVIVIITYSTLKDQWAMLYLLYDLPLIQAIVLIGDLILDLGLKISMIFIIIGIADLFYQKLKFKKDMKMTKQEVKDEYKQSEGDPHVKGKIRSKMREVSQRRMMQALPQADVVITNPTHLAAAIKYDKEKSEAPILLAKGADYLAIKIKEVAKENNIQIVENKPLARMLYYNVELGAEVPPELYQMTAEVLAYVYGLKNNK